MNLDLPGNKYVGLVGYLEGSIKNIYFSNATISGYKYVGTIAAYTSETSNIQNVGNYSGSITGIQQVVNSTVYVGGLVGYNCGNIRNSFNSADIYNSNSSAGGICCQNEGTIDDCVNRGTIDASYIGGISYSGYLSGSVYNSTNFGDLHNGYRIAGICFGTAINIENCINYGDIKGIPKFQSGTYLSGIGEANKIYNCINYGNIQFESSSYNSCYISGIGEGSINKCINFGDLKLATQTRESIMYGDTHGEIYGIQRYRSNSITDSINYGTLQNDSSGKLRGTYILNDGYAYSSINMGLITPMNGYLSSNSQVYSLIYKNSIDVANPLYNSKTYTHENFKILNFDNVWNIDSRINNGFPFLKNLPRHIDLNKNVVFLETGDIDALSAYIKSSSEAVSWKSSNDAVASISSNGALKANSLGYCTITATNSEGMKAKCHVYVYQRADSTEFTQNNLTTSIDKTVQAELKQYPSTANEAIIWSSNNDAVATVSVNGLITGKKSGTAIITATTANSNKTASCIVTVTGKPVTSLNISKSAVNMNINNTARLTVDVTPSDYQGKIEWSSSNADIAAVDDTGLITAKHPGMCYIYAKAESGITAQCTVTVKAPATEIKLNKTELNLQKGLTERLETSLTPTYSTDEIKWTTSNSNIAAVSIDGTVTAKSVGQAIISAITTSGEKAYCTVNITENPIAVSSVTLNKTSAVLTSADKIQLNATVLPENATDKSIVWKSSNEAVATVSNTGVVTAVSPGNATITATSNNGYYHECNIDVVAANGSAFIATSTKASAGEIAEYTVSVVKNPGISAYKLSIDYDTDMLEAIDIISNNDITGTFKTNIEDTDRKILNVLWYADENYSENSDLFTVKFKVKDTVENGKMLPVTLSYNAGDVCNSKHNDLAFFISNTEIEVSDPLPGDVYEDGVLNVHDILLLSRYITGLENLSSRQLIAANLIEDDVVDIKDTVKLAQILLGQPKLMITPKLISGENNVSPTVTIGSAKINDAKEIDIPVSINNNTGIAGFNFKIDYNVDELEIISITPNTDVITNDFKTNLGNEGESGLLVSWYNAQNINTNGILFTIKAKCKKSYNGISAIGIISADNNFCDDSPENVLVNYANGEIEYNSFIKENETIENGTYSADLYFDNSYEAKSAVAILALYNKNGQFLGLSSKDITIKPGRVDLSLDYDDTDYSNYKLLIWEDMSNLKPLTGVK